MKKRINIDTLSDEIIKSVYAGNIHEVNDWLKSQDKESKDRENRSLIHYAVLADNKEAVKLLLEHNVQVNVRDNRGWTPLHYAAQNYLTEIGRLLIKAGAIIDAKDDYGNTPLWRAVFASQGKGDFIHLLLENDADPNVENVAGISPLKLANTIANYNVKQFFND